MSKVARFIASVAALASIQAKAAGMNVLTTGDIPFPLGGRFYGYESSTKGPGPDAFTQALNCAKEHHVMMYIVWGKDGCSTCTAYVNELDSYGSSTPGMLGNGNTVNAYFRGKTDGTGPSACVDCYNFLRNTVGASGSCHIMAAYGVCEDGYEYKKWCSLPTSFATIAQKKLAWNKEFTALCAKHKYTPPKASAAFACGDVVGARLEATPETKTVWVPFIRTNNVENAETNKLRVWWANGQSDDITLNWMNGQERAQVDVFMGGRYSKDAVLQLGLVNTNGVEIATNHIYCVASKKNGFDYPYYAGETNEYIFGDWTLDYSLATGGVWAANTLKQADTNVPWTVEAPGSRQSFDWSTSNRYDTVYTNDLEFFAGKGTSEKAKKWKVPVKWTFDFAATNLVTTNFTGDARHFEQMKDGEEKMPVQHFEYEFENSIVTNYVDSIVDVGILTNLASVTRTALATNSCYYLITDAGLTTNRFDFTLDPQAVPFTQTNVVVNLLTNELHKTAQEGDPVEEQVVVALDYDKGVNVYYNAAKGEEGKTSAEGPKTPFDVSFKTNYPSERTFAVNYDPTPADTNLVSSVPVEKTYTITATNYLIYVWSSVPSVVTNDADLVGKAFTEEDVDTYYDVTWDDVPIEKVTPQSYCDTNKVYYLFNGSTTTNANAAEFRETKRETTQYATNFAHWVYSALKSGTVETRYDDLRANTFTLALTNTYARVETNDYQHGYNEPIYEEGFGWRTNRSEKGIQAFTLKVTGSPVWDAQSIAFTSVFTNEAFKTWCLENNVATVLNETKEPVTGASLLSHNIAANKKSGTPFISSKGISVLDDEGNPIGANLPVGDGFKVELYRPNGEIAATLTPQFNADGTCDVDENMARLDDLLKEADDKSETANDSAATPLTFDWQNPAETAQVSGQTLSVSDTEDWFKLTGNGWTGKKVVFTIEKDGAIGAENLHVEVLTNGVVVVPAVEGIFLETKMISETNYTFSAGDIAAGVFVRAVAYEDESAQTAVLGSTRFGYTLKARPIKESPGVVSFLEQSTNIICAAEDQVYRVGLTRVYGHEGGVTATVGLNDLLTTATNMYVFAEQTVSWDDGETGDKYVEITLKGTNACDGIKDITFTNSVSGSGIDKKVYKYYDVFTISYGQEPTERGPMGILWMRTTPTASEDGRIYVRYDEDADYLLFFDVYRRGGLDAATGTVSVVSSGKTIGSQTLVWGRYQTGNKMTSWNHKNLPTPGVKTGYTDATVKLTTDVEIAEGCDKLNVRVLAKDAPAFASESVTWGDAVQYVAFSNAVDVMFANESGALIESALPLGWVVQGAVKISESTVPTGLKVSADKATGALVVTGTPTAATEEPMTSIWWMKFKDAQGNVVMSSPVTLTITVKALAKTDVNPEGLIPGFESARAWTGLPLVDKETKRLAGLLDMTVAKNGRTTAKWRKAGGKNVSFSAASLTGCVQEGAETNVYVEATKTQSKVVNEFCVTFWADGKIEGVVSEGRGQGPASTEGGEAMFEVPAAEVWSKEHTAAAWEGNYTLAFPHDDVAGAFDNNTLCFGATSLRVKFTSASQFKTGKATFAGYLPNGRSVSGTAAFVPAANGAEVATLPIFYSTSADTFGAVVDVLKAGLSPAVSPSETATNFWQHVESGLPGASYTNDYAAVGTRYEADDWEEVWGETYQTNALCFAIHGEDAGARIAAKGATLKVAEKGELKAIAFSLNKTSGLATGTFRDGADAAATREPLAENKTATWRGVAIPGTDPLVPFMAGAYWYTKVYVDEQTGKRRSVKAGGVVSLEPVQAE